jgi:hypothetical protein
MPQAAEAVSLSAPAWNRGGRPLPSRLHSWRAAPEHAWSLARTPFLAPPSGDAGGSHLVEIAGAVGEEAGPGQGQAEVSDAHGLHEGNIVQVFVVKVGGDVGGLVVVDLAGCGAEGVPDAGAAPALVRRALRGQRVARDGGPGSTAPLGGADEPPGLRGSEGSRAACPHLDLVGRSRCAIPEGHL